MSAYYISPPKLKTYSPFFKATAIRKAKQAVKWADQEYLRALKLASDSKRWRVHQILTSEWSGMRLLSQLEDFRWFCAMFAQDEELWNQLDRETRKFITKAYNMYELLRN